MNLDDHHTDTTVASRRYDFQRKLGEGGSGVVYLVRDRETGEQLAWKQLRRADERSIATLKREFRTLSAINHKNVVRLYDLGRAQDAWFVTMEYIDGQTLLDHLDVGATSSSDLRRTNETIGADTIDLKRIVSVFHQLATGVQALHQNNVLHRDLKPSNVLVEKGRVVVLDFGLALTIGDQASTVTLNGAIVGTPAYMAPEQLQGRDWGEPNDWYSFGVMLFEALTGCLPIEGRLQELLRRKIERDAMPIERCVSGLPQGLTQLCNALLSRQPDRRPTGTELLRALQECLEPAGKRSSGEHVESQVRPRAINSGLAFFGRESEQAQLLSAHNEVLNGGSAVVHVYGVSGAGKTGLIEHFLEQLEEQDSWAQTGAIVLRGRCYERETVPFKALDDVMDALVAQLSREDDLEVSHAMPRDVQALTQLFPALSRLQATQRLLEPAAAQMARPHVREAAETALRELFARLGSRRPVILWIDDLHWGDLDSARILRSWMAPPGIPGLLLVLSYRSDELSTSPCLRWLTRGDTSESTARTLSVESLRERDIRALCMQRLASVETEISTQLRDEIVEHIVSEAGGSPFLASQLAILALAELSDAVLDSPEVLTIESLVARRTALLSTHARRLLHVLSVAGRPLPTQLALKLSATTSNARASVHELSGLSLIRSRTSDGERMLAVYHDRLREALLASLGQAERTNLVRELLQALQDDGCTDCAWLHALALDCGATDSALHYGQLAADRAMQALAFERAAQLYRVCVGLSPRRSEQNLGLWEKLALALAHSGHGRQAANAYREAAERAQGTRALRLERRAASHLLRSGAYEEGEALIHKVLAKLDLDTPSSSAGLIAAIGWERARLAVRGMRFQERTLEQVDPAARFEGELCGTLSVELQPYDPLRAALFQAWSLRIALDAGAPELLARALCVAATMAAVTGGGQGVTRARTLLDRAQELEQQHRSPLVRGNIHTARAVCAMLWGRIRDALESSTEAERMFREGSGSDEGEYYHRFMVTGTRVTALFELGQHVQAAEELKRLLNEARATENVAAQLLMSPIVTRHELALDQAERAARRLEAEHAQLPPHRFGLLNAWYVGSVMRVGCATSDYEWALHWMHHEWERLQSSVLKRGGAFGVIAPMLHARLLLNRAVAKKLSANEVALSIESDVRGLERSRSPVAMGSLSRVKARLSVLSGERSQALTHLQRSIATFEKYKVIDETARDRFAYGALLKGPQGAALQAGALEVLRNHGYVNPLKNLRAYYPELL